MKTFRCSTLILLLICFLFLEDESFGQGPADAPTSIETLPSWAELMERSASHGLPSQVEDAVETDGPTLPPASRVPVDGGLIWLLAAGGTLALHKLRGANQADD